MKKSIDVVVKYFYPVTAGIETNIMETYSRLADKGWDITIHTSANTYLEKNILPKSETIRYLNIKRYPFKWYGFFPEINYSRADIIALHNFNIFPHVHILMRVLILKILGRKNFKLALTPHGGFNPEWSTFSPLQVWIKKKYHYTLGVKLINSTVDFIRAVSGWEKQEMQHKGIKGELIKVIDNGIEDEAYMDVDKLASLEIKKQVGKFGKYIIQVGRVYPIKNYETAIKALAEVPKDINYVIVGSTQDKQYLNTLKDLIKRLRLGKRVFFTGVIKGVDKYYLIKHAQLMVHMALWESYCNVVHEGMSQGLVCVVADNTALPLLIKNGENGFLIETTDVEMLAEKINFILKNKNTDKIKKMQENSRIFGLKNSWRRVARKLEEYFTNNLI